MRIWRMLRHARRSSINSDHIHRIGAVICAGSIIKSRGFNQVRRARIGSNFTNFPESLHAERHACIQMSKDDIKGCDIYIWREYKTGSPAIAKPCDKCYTLLESLGIKRIIYSTSTFPYYEVIRL